MGRAPRMLPGPARGLVPLRAGSKADISYVSELQYELPSRNQDAACMNADNIRLLSFAVSADEIHRLLIGFFVEGHCGWAIIHFTNAH